jgi:hypothetical protein
MMIALLEWCQWTSKKTVPINSKLSNVGMIKSALGFKGYNAYEMMLPQDQYFVYYAANVTDDEAASNSGSTPSASQREPYDDQREDIYKHPDNVLPQSPMQSTFSVDGLRDAELPEVIPDEEDRYSAGDLLAEFLHYHHRFGHCSPKKMQRMAVQGIIPRRLAKCKVPLCCTSCLYGEATRRPWRQSKHQGPATCTVTAQGQCISINQLESPMPRLIAQLRGILTKKRYTCCATVFVNQFSKWGYVHLQKLTGADEKIEAKQAFEAVAKTHGITIQH